MADNPDDILPGKRKRLLTEHAHDVVKSVKKVVKQLSPTPKGHATSAKSKTHRNSVASESSGLATKEPAQKKARRPEIVSDNKASNDEADADHVDNPRQNSTPSLPAAQTTSAPRSTRSSSSDVQVLTRQEADCIELGAPDK
ncbi:hypothetical protein C0991_008884 [Blastosporella zonata]|nr:hypothetical protein C0991_008884 [Blastosporella zonata]